MKLENESPRTVFVIDDDQAILEVLGLLLKRWNFAVVVANNLESAAEVWRANRDRITAVVSDKCLKVGEDCSPFLRQIHVERPELPLIVMSGYSQDESEPFMTEWEGMRYLTKPFEPSELFRALDSAPTG
jgi:DNA-binding NtrC family response regulator